VHVAVHVGDRVSKKSTAARRTSDLGYAAVACFETLRLSVYLRRFVTLHKPLQNFIVMRDFLFGFVPRHEFSEFARLLCFWIAHTVEMRGPSRAIPKQSSVGDTGLALFVLDSVEIDTSSHLVENMKFSFGFHFVAPFAPLRAAGSS
jgi:hypothetical protein